MHSLIFQCHLSKFKLHPPPRGMEQLSKKGEMSNYLVKPVINGSSVFGKDPVKSNRYLRLKIDYQNMIYFHNFYNLIINLHQLKFLSYTNLVCHSRKLSWNCVRDRPKNKTDRGTWLLRHRNNSRYPEWLWNLGLSCQRNRRSQ